MYVCDYLPVIRPCAIVLLYLKNNTKAVRSRVSSKLVFSSCAILRSRVSQGVYVLMKDVGRRLPEVLRASTGAAGGIERRSVFCIVFVLLAATTETEGYDS